MTLSDWLLRSWCGVVLLASMYGFVEATHAQESGPAQELRTSSEPSHLGVVWTPPAEPDSAVRVLNRMRTFGITAVRLTRPPTDTLAARADTLNLRLFVDLPVSYAPASALADSLAQADSTLDEVLDLAERHASITHIGLARSADTTVPALCDVLDRWTTQVHDRFPSLRTYYITPFSASADRCADTVDLPLLDVRAIESPVEQWAQWPNHAERVGIGAVGTWTRPGAGSGLRIAHSPEWQARHLERALSSLLDSSRAVPPAVFIFRWSDPPSSLLPSRQYGLHSADGRARPAADIVRGFYTGQQQAFAFPSGSAPRDNPHVLLLLGWGLAVLLGLVYAQSLFVRRTVARYFTAHGFYRDSIRQGGKQDVGLHALLLSIVAVALGATGVLAARLAALQPVTERVLSALPSGLQTPLAGGLEHPTAVGIAVGGLFLTMLLSWTIALVVAARRHGHFSVGQGLMLVAWPCWPTVFALPVALATGPESPISPSVFALLLLVGGTITLLYITGRVLLDYKAVTNLPWTLAILLALPSPFVLTATGAVLIAMRDDVPLRFLWRLATQT